MLRNFFSSTSAAFANLEHSGVMSLESSRGRLSHPSEESKHNSAYKSRPEKYSLVPMGDRNIRKGTKLCIRQPSLGRCKSCPFMIFIDCAGFVAQSIVHQRNVSDKWRAAGPAEFESAQPAAPSATLL
eukprot:scaffold319247_cov27-Prasinocladus_malaysianus.AAC.1